MIRSDNSYVLYMSVCMLVPKLIAYLIEDPFVFVYILNRVLSARDLYLSG